MASTHFAQNVVHGHVDILQGQGVHREPGELAETLELHQAAFADPGHGEVQLDQERREVLPVDLGEEDEQIRPPGVGDPLLGPVQHVVRAGIVQLGPRLDVHGVGTRARLREGECRQHLALHARSEIAVDLLRRAEVHDG